jgi:hypothetical protein
MTNGSAELLSAGWKHPLSCHLHCISTLCKRLQGLQQDNADNDALTMGSLLKQIQRRAPLVKLRLLFHEFKGFWKFCCATSWPYITETNW